MSVGINYLRSTRDYRETHNIRQTLLSDSTWRNNSLLSITEYNDMNLPLEIIGQSYMSPDYVEVTNSSKVNYDYNSNGDIILRIDYDWDENEWIYTGYGETYYNEEFRYYRYHC